MLVSMVYGAAKENSALRKDYRFKDQISAAAVSVMSNIAEGFCRRTNREFVQFLFIAQSLLYAGLDQSYLSQEKFDILYQKTDLIARLLSRLITYLLDRTRTQRTQQTQ